MRPVRLARPDGRAARIMHAKTMPDMLTITRPDDWHVHLRDGDPMRSVVGATARIFGRAVLMPNLDPPITTVAAAAAYRDRVVAALPAGSRFTPLLTLYLTDNTSPAEIERARAAGFIIGVKYYPAGATTNSASGVTDAGARLSGARRNGKARTAAAGARRGHRPRRRRVRPRTRLRRTGSARASCATSPRSSSWSSTSRRARPPSSSPPHRRMSARRSRRSICCGRAMRCSRAGCGRMPTACRFSSAKRIGRRWSTRRPAATPKYFLGTDSAPHARHAKESACGCAGCFSAPLAIELYAEVFDAAGKLDRLEAFASFHGADFYGLPRNAGTITLEREVLDGAGELSVRRRDGRAAAAPARRSPGASLTEALFSVLN